MSVPECPVLPMVSVNSVYYTAKFNEELLIQMNLYPLHIQTQLYSDLIQVMHIKLCTEQEMWLP